MLTRAQFDEALAKEWGVKILDGEEGKLDELGILREAVVDASRASVMELVNGLLTDAAVYDGSEYGRGYADGLRDASVRLRHHVDV